MKNSASYRYDNNDYVALRALCSNVLAQAFSDLLIAKKSKIKGYKNCEERVSGVFGRTTTIYMNLTDWFYSDVELVDEGITFVLVCEVLGIDRDALLGHIVTPICKCDTVKDLKKIGATTISRYLAFNKSHYKYSYLNTGFKKR